MHSLHSQRKETFERTQRGKSRQPPCERGICDVPIQHPWAFVWLPARSRTATTLTGNSRKLRLGSEAGPQCGFSRRTRLLCHLSAEPSENDLPPHETHSTSLMSRELWALSTTTWGQENKQRHQPSHRVLHIGEAGGSRTPSSREESSNTRKAPWERWQATSFPHKCAPQTAIGSLTAASSGPLLTDSKNLVLHLPVHRPPPS